MCAATLASRWRSLPPWASPAALAGLCAVMAARLLTLPESPWEHDEILFLRGVETFDPLTHRPHPPGYPAYVGLGKVFAALFGDPFTGLVALAVLATLVGYPALVDAFARAAAAGSAIGGRELAAGIAGATLFHLCPSMLVYGPLALSDPVALGFLSLALAAALRLPVGGLGAALACAGACALAIGTRPQLAVSVLPLLAVALWLAPSWRRRAQMLASFTAVCLLWFVPLVLAVGGPAQLVPFLARQAGFVATYDTAMPRAGQSFAEIATRFVAHPWGTRLTSLPLLALAAAGGMVLLAGRRLRGAAPIAVLCGVELALCLAVLAPRDAVRYALPATLAVAFLAGVGLAALAWRLPSRAAAGAAAAGLVALAVGFAWYSAPLLVPRATSASPPVQAAVWIRANLPSEAVLLVERDLLAHAAYLLPRRGRFPVEAGLDRYAGRARPLYLVGETVGPDSQVFAWPDSDAYGKLTRLLYRVVAVTPVPPETRYRSLQGVHKYEREVAGPGWRWLAGEAAIRLYPGGGHGVEAMVTIGLPERVPWPANRVRLGIEGTPAVEVEVPAGATRTVALPLPAAPSADLWVRSTASFVPVAAGIGGDARRVAVQLRDVRLRRG